MKRIYVLVLICLTGCHAAPTGHLSGESARVACMPWTGPGRLPAPYFEPDIWLQNMSEALWAHRIERGIARHQVREALDRAGFAPLSNRLVDARLLHGGFFARTGGEPRIAPLLEHPRRGELAVRLGRTLDVEALCFGHIVDRSHTVESNRVRVRLTVRVALVSAETGLLIKRFERTIEATTPRPALPTRGTVDGVSRRIDSLWGLINRTIWKSFDHLAGELGDSWRRERTVAEPAPVIRTGAFRVLAGPTGLSELDVVFLGTEGARGRIEIGSSSIPPIPAQEQGGVYRARFPIRPEWLSEEGALIRCLLSTDGGEASLELSPLLRHPPDGDGTD